MFTQAPTPWYLAHPGIVQAVAGSPTARTAQAVYIHDVYLPAPGQLTGFTVDHGAVAAGHIDLGVYDSAGNLLAHTGVTSVNTFANALQTINLPQPLALGAGRYYYAFWSDNNTDTYYVVTGLTVAAANLLNVNNLQAGGLASSFAAMGGVVAGSTLVPFLGHLAGTGF